MIRVLFVTVFLLIASPAFGVIANTASAIIHGSGANTYQVTLSGQASGQWAVACASTDLADATTTGTVSDSSGSTWTKIQTIDNVFTRNELWISQNILGANVTVTLLTSSAVSASLAASSYSGTVALGTSTTHTGSGVGTYTISLTTGDANNFVVACFSARTGSGSSISANTGTLRQSYDGTDTSAVNAVADNTAAGAGSVTVSINQSGAYDYAATAVELRSTTGAAPSVRRRAVVVQ